MAELNRATVTWAANTEPDLAGYRVYAGFIPGSYTIAVDVGNVLTATLGGSAPTGLFTNDGIWYFAVSAYDTSNNESLKSTPVTKRIIRTLAYFNHRR